MGIETRQQKRFQKRRNEASLLSRDIDPGGENEIQTTKDQRLRNGRIRNSPTKLAAAAAAEENLFGFGDPLLA